jgi:hypothetical protein
MPFNPEERRERHRLAVQRSRARETPTARSERLRRDRERHRCAAESSVPALRTGNNTPSPRLALPTTAHDPMPQSGDNAGHAEVMSVNVEDRREGRRLATQRSRARETPAARSDRLRPDRERHRRASRSIAPELQSGNSPDSAGLLPAVNVTAQTDDDDRHADIDHAWGIGDEIPRLHPVPAACKQDCLQRLELALGAVGLDETACAVCDRTQLRKTCRVIEVSNTTRMQQLHELLSSDGEALPAALVADYDCSSLNATLQSVLLSKRGVRPDGNLCVCQECDDSLLKLSIPKFSIKNGFFVGALPRCFSGMTLPERLMTQTVSVVAVTRVMRGGAHRAIRSHCLAFDATPGPPATLLPIPIDSVSSYRVVLAGPFTTEQQARVRKMHRVRCQVVEDILRFYRQHNPFYERVAVDCTELPMVAIAENLIVEDADADVEIAEMEAEHDRVGSVSENDVSSVETDVVEHRVVFISDDREVTTQDVPPVERHGDETSQPQFLVRHSSEFAQQDSTLFARMFPHLFPYGRGHPGEPRHVPVSLNLCIRYYAQLSSRRFAEDELFMLASFDYLSVHRMYMQVALKCQRNPAMFEPFCDITEDALLEALSEKELQRQGRTTSARSQDSSAAAFVKTVEISGSAMWGSDGERAQCRRRAFAYQAWYGQPALFVTLTPNVADTFVMAQYCGITSVDTLFDATLAEQPGRSALHSAGLRNDVASARLFMHNVDAFVEHALGVPSKCMRTKAFDGFFGNVKVYYGMVETQGGGTLHVHFLVWLTDAPPNTDAFDRAVATHGNQYYRDVEAFADSIVSTSMPLHVADSSCVFCGHSYVDLQELPIPPEAYEDPNKRQRGRKARGEPALWVRKRTQLPARHSTCPARPSAVVMAAPNATVLLDRAGVCRAIRDAMPRQRSICKSRNLPPQSPSIRNTRKC